MIVWSAFAETGFLGKIREDFISNKQEPLFFYYLLFYIRPKKPYLFPEVQVVKKSSPRWLQIKKKLYGPFLRIGFSCLKATATSRRQFTFYHSIPRNSWYSFYRPWKDERLSRPWSHPMVLNTGPMDWESSPLTTRLLLLELLLFNQFNWFF